jgi:hypothetical protein
MNARVVISGLRVSADLVEVLEARAWARAHLYRAGEFSLHEAVDPLQHWAVTVGLVERIGAGAVQRILSDAFAVTG